VSSICQVVIKQSSGSRQAVIRLSSGSCHVVISQVTNSCQAVIKQSSGSLQAVIRLSSCSHQAGSNQSFISQPMGLKAFSVFCLFYMTKTKDLFNILTQFNQFSMIYKRQN
jgi:hypothetical protein